MWRLTQTKASQRCPCSFLLHQSQQSAECKATVCVLCLNQTFILLSDITSCISNCAPKLNSKWVRQRNLRSVEFKSSTIRSCVCFLRFVCSDLTDADVEVEGVPVAPLDVRCHDVNKDYVVVTWKQPAVEGSSSILGYYIDRLVRKQIHLFKFRLKIKCF